MTTEKSPGIRVRVNAPGSFTVSSKAIAKGLSRPLLSDRGYARRPSLLAFCKLICALALAALCTATWAQQDEPPTPLTQSQQVGIDGVTVLDGGEPQGIIVKFRQGTGHSKREQALSKVAKRVRHFGKANIRANGKPGSEFFDELVSAELQRGVGLGKALQMLKKNGSVEYVEPNLPVSIADTFPVDTDFQELWGLHNTGQTGGTPDADIDMPEAWDLGTGSSDVVVAVIDTGIDYTHPDLADNMWINVDEIPGNGIDDDQNGIVDDIHGANFITGDGDPLDDHFHGTHCAGTIGAVANNGIGVAGINWDVRLMALKFLGSGGSGNTADAIAAIQYAINNGARVLSNSWGSSLYLQSLQDAITAAHDAGILVVAAAGNSNTDQLFYPAAYDHVVAVAATDHNDAKASFSNFGSHVDIAAPGVNIYSTFPTYTTAAMGSSFSTDYETISGTSMACPHVAGLAALLLGRNPAMTADDLETTIKFAADDLGEPGFDLIYGWGRINAHAAMSAVEPGEETNFPQYDITAPLYGEKVSGMVDVTGTAAGETFASYLLERSDPQAGWVTISASSTPVTGGLLGQWSTTDAADGKRGLRLTVEDRSGAKFYDYVEIEINNIEAELNMTNLVGGETSLEILGTANVNSGTFSSYQIEYGQGLAPTEWSTDRITLAGNGASPVQEGLLGTLDTVGLAPGYYVLRLTVSSSSASETFDHKIYIDPDLASGFPVRTEGSLYGAIGIGDLDTASPGNEILLSLSKGTKIFGSDGSHLSTLDTDIVFGDPKLVQPNGTALGELSGDLPGLEYAYFFKDWARLHAANGDAFLPGMPLSLDSSDVSHPYENQGTTMLYDVDNDAHLDIIVPTVAYWDDMIYLNVLDSSGDAVAGFPFSSSYPNVYSMRAGAVGDLDGDQRAEIFFTAQESLSLSYDFVRGTLFALDDEGQLLPGFPIDFLPVDGGTVDLGDIHIADLDGDGQKEILFVETSANSGANHYRLAVHALEKNGQELSGWPFTLEGTIADVGYTVPDGGGTLAIGDVTGDGVPEVVIAPSFGASGSIYWAGTSIRVLSNSGDQLYTISNIHTNEYGVSNAAKTAGLYIADLDADGNGEVLTSRYITLGPQENKVTALAVLAYSGTEVVKQWIANSVFDPATGTSYTPYPGGGIGLAIDDVDGDGNLELAYAADAYAASAPGLLTDSILYTWDLGIPYDQQALQWSIMGGNVARTGEYKASVQVEGLPVADAGVDQNVEDMDHDGLETVTLDGTGSFDTDGQLVSYEWFENGQLIANGATPSVSFAVGVHSLQLTVTDDSSLTDDDAVSITVLAPNLPPVAAAGADQEVSASEGSGVMSVNLDGSDSYDPDGSITQYQWLENGALIATGVSPSVELPVGEHSITLTVVDDGTPPLSNNDDVTIIVDGGPDGTAPSVQITSPVDGGTVPRRSSLTVTASAEDDSGSVEKVEFFLDGNLKSTDSVAPFEYDWKVPGAKGRTYVLQAWAYDAAGNIGYASAVQVTAQ